MQHLSGTYVCKTVVVDQGLCDHIPAVRRNNENSLTALFGLEVNVPMTAVKKKPKTDVFPDIFGNMAKSDYPKGLSVRSEPSFLVVRSPTNHASQM